MARYSDDNEYSGYDSYSRGSDTPKSSGGREHFGDTSSFSTTLISSDGRFLGLKLSDDLASQMRTFYPALLDWARRKGEKLGIPLAKRFAKDFMGVAEHEATKFSEKSGNVIGYSIILSNQIADLVRNIYDSSQYLGELRSAIKPLQHVDKHSAPLSGSNEVVANARAKINGIFWSRLMQTATGTIAIAPALGAKLKEQHIRNEERSTLHAIAEADNDPEKVAEILQKKLSVGGLEEVKSSDIQRGVEKLIEKERKAYLVRMEEFVKSQKNAMEREMRSTFDIKPENVRQKIHELKRYGVDTHALEYATSTNYRHTPSDQEVQAAIDKFQKDLRSNRSYYVEQALKKKFVRQNGAFDGDQTHLLDSEDRNRRHTISQDWEEKINDLRQKQLKRDKEADTDPQGVGRMAAGLGAGIVAELASKAVGGKALDKYREPVALDRILHLRREMEKAGDSPPEEVPGIRKGNGEQERDISYVEYVHRIFQQHQKDCGRTEIGSRFFEHLEGARWNDAAVQQLHDDELTAYEYAVKTVAKRIKDGRMDAIALVTLVGDKQQKLIRDDGRTFGPRGSGSSDADIKAAMLKVIDEQTILLHTGQGATETEVNDKLGNFVFSIDDIKHALSSKDISQQERSFIFTIFSNVIGSDEKLCSQIGISMEQCHQLRAETKENFNKLLDGAVLVLAEMIEKHPEELAKKMQLTDNEKQVILSLAERMQREDRDVADLAVNREEVRTLETTVANAAMVLDKNENGKLETNKPQGFWQRLITAARKPRDASTKSADSPADMSNSYEDTQDTPRHTEGMQKRDKWNQFGDGEDMAASASYSTAARETSRRNRREGEPTELGA